MQWMGRALKRLLDVAGAGVGLLLSSPVLGLVALWIRVSMGRPILFRQERAGLGGGPLRLYKLRTMTEERGPDGRLLPDEERLTRLGRWLRRWSVDELPQLWNVLKGDMSLVGPRPLLVEYVRRYSARQRKRLEVKPGITGWAQVRGRNALTWEEKFELDVWYVENWSLWLDIKILALTAWKVLRGEGISQPGYATMQEFMGSAQVRCADRLEVQS